jgi:DNA-binding transcriptional LysR family regulator
MKLLPAGEVFLSHARRILAEVDTAVERTRGAGGESSSS